MFIVLAAVSVGLSVLLSPFVFLLDAGQSSQLSSSMSSDPLQLVLTVMILGPLVEEILFRSWLTGRWRDIIGAGVFGVVLFGLGDLLPRGLVGGDAAHGYLVLSLALTAFVFAVRMVGTDARSPHFERAFPVIFWLSVVIFGGLHLTNYSGSGGWALLVFTVPQIVAGAFFGFARVAIGLPLAIALHMAYNAVPVTATLVARALS